MNSIIDSNYDLIFVAAGVGKPNIFNQLTSVNCPIIDVGHFVDIWSGKKLKEIRPYTKNFNQAYTTL